MTCPGIRRQGKPLGICTTCDRHDPAGTDEPAARLRMEGIASWDCPNRSYTAPVDRYGSHRFAAIAANCKASDISARRISEATAASAQV